MENQYSRVVSLIYYVMLAIYDIVTLSFQIAKLFLNTQNTYVKSYVECLADCVVISYYNYTMTITNEYSSVYFTESAIRSTSFPLIDIHSFFFV